ncbi:MAG: transcription antitermination factor NusB [Nitrosomonadales bacterium]|jgi:N utilization substance protein B
MKKINNRRKSRELVMKSLYRGIVNDFDYSVIKKDITEDPDYIRSDQKLLDSLLQGIESNYVLISDNIKKFTDKKLDDLSPIELSILILATYELIFSLDTPFKVIINEALEITKTYGSVEGYKFVNGILDKLAKEHRVSEVILVS